MGLLNTLNLKKEGRIVEKWSFQADSHLLCGPTVTDLTGNGNEDIIIATKTGKIILLDANGNLRWEYKITEKVDDVDMMFMDAESVNSILSPPRAIDIDGDGKKEILFGTQLGTLYALTTEGKLLWKYATGSAIRGAATCADINNDGKMEILIGSDDKKLHVLTNKGRLLWSRSNSSGIQTTPAVSLAHKMIIYGDDDGKIVSLSFDNQQNWTYQTGGKIVAEATIARLFSDEPDHIIVGSTDNTIYVLDSLGNLRWSYPTQGSIIAGIVVTDIDNDHIPDIIASSCDNSLYMLSREGQKIWSYETNFWVGSSAIALDIDGDGRNEIIFGSYDHNLYILTGEGSYMLEHLPGLSHIIHQAGHYSDVQTQDPGESIGNKIWQFSLPDIITGVSHLTKKRAIIATCKTGKVVCLCHET